MTEIEQLINMLTRANIGHGIRHDFDPRGKSVQIEEEGDESSLRIIEFSFDNEGKLKSVTVHEDDDDDIPAVHQSPATQTVNTTFHDDGRHEPLPFPEDDK